MGKAKEVMEETAKERIKRSYQKLKSLKKNKAHKRHVSAPLKSFK
jgi:hypothetical protein